MIATGNGGDERRYDRNSQRLAKKKLPWKNIEISLEKDLTFIWFDVRKRGEDKFGKV